MRYKYQKANVQISIKIEKKKVSVYKTYPQFENKVLEKRNYTVFFEI